MLILNMKKLLGIVIFGLFWCNVGYAKIGDVYYCVMDQIAKTDAEGSTSFKTQKFKFNREKNALKFGSSESFFKNNTETVTFNAKEYFFGGNDYGRFIYREGKLIYSQLLNHPTEGVNSVTVIATCEIF
tara:strand:- start:163 stop:549 length:387 start_codon:yes stop_codon:yes gene_type:complete